MLELLDRASAIGWGTIIAVIALAILLIPLAIEAVSYTHLDVYKRQVTDRIYSGFREKIDGRRDCEAGYYKQHL